MAVDVFKNFIFAYLECRDKEKTLSFLGTSIFSIGTGENESAINRQGVELLIHDEILASPSPIIITYHSIDAAQVSETVVVVQTAGTIKFYELDGEDVTMEIRHSATLVFDGEQFKIVALHCSTPTAIQEEEEFLPIRFAQKTIKELENQNKHTLLSLLDTCLLYTSHIHAER